MKALFRRLFTPLIAIAWLLLPAHALAATNVSFSPFSGTPPGSATWTVVAAPTTGASSSTCTLDSSAGRCTMTLNSSTLYNVAVTNGTESIPQGAVYVTATNFVEQFPNANVETAGGQIDGNQIGVQEYRGTYDFTVQGGATGDVSLGVVGGSAAPIALPANAVILDGVVDVVTACTGGGANISIGTSATAYGNILSTGLATSQCSSGLHAISQANTAASGTKLTVSGQPVIKISSQTLTAGKLVLFLRYFVSG